MLTEIEKRIIAEIQGDIPVTERPYLKIAERLKISEEQLIERLKELCHKGIIRRFGATLRHQKSGFEANAMAAWVVDEDRIMEVGRKMASFEEVSHCYRRNPTDGWPFNLYTMVHAKNEDACRRIVRKMAEQTATKKYTLLFSRRELKKTSMEYFTSEQNS
ncbi:MAG: Lrp/AsnC family transcriptional regulator [Deltaproteobacteria bacterium]|nr:Lrp/AsnC family transcriptional regulator [Deltaproteobacteria bacterium]MBW1960705.1 Lrp/AsnC family transcriptional regulator [Deltaproteobacteria bacterium]MBW2151970.1 Lrp/AsnC family transcriptional regulator [Deltaproteobacteria bacterium]